MIESWKKIWHDPVWSKVIAWSITGILTTLAALLTWHFRSVSCPEKIAIPIILSALAVSAVLGLYYTRSKVSGSGNVLFYISLIALPAALITASVLWILQACPPPPMYPRDDGLIADFTSGKGGPARTALDTQFSLLSDSAWNQQSEVWYSRVEEGDNGFLRIHYKLAPSGNKESYAGVYADFSLPPPVAFDLSRFRRLALRLRCDAVNPKDVRAAIVLYSKEMKPLYYTFPTWLIPSHNLSNDWVSIHADLDEFRCPHFANQKVKLDKRQVYRVAAVIYNKSDRFKSGYIDIDDLRFE